MKKTEIIIIEKYIFQWDVCKEENNKNLVGFTCGKRN